MATAVAQTSSSIAEVYDFGSRTCVNGTPQQPMGSAIACTTPLTGGSGIGISASDNATRSLSASAGLTQTGALGSMNGLVFGASTQRSSIFVTGTSGATDNLIFHFASTHQTVFSANSGSTMQGTEYLLLQAPERLF